MKDIEKLEDKEFGIEVDFNGQKVKQYSNGAYEIEQLFKKVNEIIDYINSKKDQLL